MKFILVALCLATGLVFPDSINYLQDLAVNTAKESSINLFLEIFK
jgi:hypothetical protein